MRVLALALFKIAEFAADFFNLKNMEAWLLTAYINWWPVVIRLFQ